MKQATKFLVEHAAAGLFMDPGLRKTSITLAAFEFLRQRKLARKMLVVAPKRVIQVTWPEEVQKWADFRHLRYVVLHGPDKERLLQYAADLYLVTPDGLEWLLEGRTPKEVKALGFDLLVVDELTKFKHPRSKRFKRLKRWLPTFKRRWGLTGSPAANGLLDLFGQCYVLDEGRALGRFITHYKIKHFDPPVWGFRWSVKDGHEKLIYRRLKNLTLRMAAEDHLDLPPLLENVVRVSLPDSARASYDQLEDELITVIKSRVVDAANTGVALGRCRQLCAGAIYDPAAEGRRRRPGKATRAWLHLHDEKLDAVDDLVEALNGQQALIAYEFQHDLERLSQRFKGAGAITGGQSEKKLKETLMRWASGDLRILLVHPMAGGHGLNLQASGCAHVVWFTPTWDFELFDQLNRRVYRSGTTAKRVTIHQLIARDTVDEAVVQSLKKKDKGQRALFQALMEMRRK